MADTLFISHANEDTSAVEPIVAYLEANGVPCWISSRDIPPRAIYAEAITQGVNNSAACVVIVSRAANESDAIKRELELASHYKKRFIPIRIDETEPGVGLDYYLRNTQWVDYGRERERGLDRIIANMKGGAAAHRPAPSYTPPPPPRPSYTPPPSEPAATHVSVPMSLIVIAALAVVGVGGWFVFSQNRDEPAATSEVVTTEPAAVPPADTGYDGATEDAARRLREEQAALARQRDEALAAAQAAEQQLAYERAQRAAAPAQANIANSNWWGTTTYPGLTNIGWHFGSQGVACWGTTRGDYSACTPFSYTLNGNHLVLTNTTNQERWDGTVSGNTFSGSLLAANGTNHTFSVYRE